MDSMLQAWLFVEDTRSLFVLTEIQKLTINIKQHIVYLQSLDVNAEQGEFQMCFFCTCGREYIEFISFKSAVMWCDVSSGMWLLMCQTAVPSNHGSPHAHMSEDECTAVPLWECQILHSVASQVGLLHLVHSFIHLLYIHIVTHGTLTCPTTYYKITIHVQSLQNCDNHKVKST